MTDDERAAYDAGQLGYPRCYRCGHNYFDRPLQPLVDGKVADGELCHWCVDELRDSRPVGFHFEEARAMDDRIEHPNTGHGQVRPRADGAKARCGGPALCAECQREQAAYQTAGLRDRLDTAIALLEQLREARPLLLYGQPWIVLIGQTLAALQEPV